MAEGLTNALLGDRYEAASAGTEPSSVNPRAAATLMEIGIDISAHRSKSVDEFKASDFDLVVTVCDGARETCPILPGAGRTIHNSFVDPSGVIGTDEEVAAAFRKTRDEIRSWLVENFK